MSLATTTDILTRIKQELRDELSTAATETRLLARLNAAYIDILEGGGHLNDSVRGQQAPKPFILSLALSPTNIVFNTELPLLDYSVTVTQNSTSATLSATYATSLVGWFIRIAGKDEVYRIAAHTAGTNTITLDSGFLNSSVTAGECKIFKLDYEIGTDILLPTNGLINFKHNTTLPIMNKSEFDKVAQMKRISQGFPRFAVVQKNDAVNKSLTIRLNSYTKESERFELPYIPYPTPLNLVDSNPILRPSDNQMLVDYVVAQEYDLRDDDIADKYMKRAMDRFRIMKSIDKQFTAWNDPMYAKILGWSRDPDTIRGSLGLNHPNRNN